MKLGPSLMRIFGPKCEVAEKQRKFNFRGFQNNVLCSPNIDRTMKSRMTRRARYIQQKRGKTKSFNKHLNDIHKLCGPYLSMCVKGFIQMN
jgi:hypothetical protein